MFDERLEEFVYNRILDNTVSILKEIISCLDHAREQGALCNFCSVDPDSDHVDTCPTKVPLWRCSEFVVQVHKKMPPCPHLNSLEEINVEEIKRKMTDAHVS